MCGDRGYMEVLQYAISGHGRADGTTHCDEKRPVIRCSQLHCIKQVHTFPRPIHDCSDILFHYALLEQKFYIELLLVSWSRIRPQRGGWNHGRDERDLRCSQLNCITRVHTFPGPPINVRHSLSCPVSHYASSEVLWEHWYDWPSRLDDIN
jgi:hypothetical protein